MLLTIPGRKLQDNVKPLLSVFTGISSAVACTQKELDYGSNRISCISIVCTFDNLHRANNFDMAVLFNDPLKRQKLKTIASEG